LISNSSKVGVVILNWNAFEMTVECIESLRKLDYPSYELYIVDNASTDGSYEKLLSSKFNGDVHVILNPTNLGYAGGVNAGIVKAIENGCSYIWLVNNDAKIINSSALTELVKTCEEDKKIGAAGSLIKYPTGEIQFAGGEIKLPLVKGIHFEENLNRVSETEYVTGCSLLIPKQVIERIGLISEDYFLYYEDADYCKKIKQAGYKCVVVPNSILEHELGGTSSKSPSLNYVYYNLRNRFLYSYKWLNKTQFTTFFALTTFETLARALRYIILGRKESLAFLFRAYFDGFRKKTGKFS
jgi:GT2 family glycosyltransferase